MGIDEYELFRTLIERANQSFDGHLTIMKFTTTWRVGFVTPGDRDEIHNMPVGNTFAEAALKALSST